MQSAVTAYSYSRCSKIARRSLWPLREPEWPFSCQPDNPRTNSPASNPIMIVRGSALAAALFLSQLVLAQTPAPATPATQGDDGEEKAQVCAACHGANGNSTNSMY